MKIRELNKNQYCAFAVLLTLIAITGCAKKTKPEESVISTAPSIEENALGDSDSGRALGLNTIHFPFDSALLDEKAKAEINSNYQILKEKPSLKVQIEGHCDQRGGIQYNIALGERRAKSVLHYLTNLGIPSDRINIISYGKERPIDRANTEEAYAKNRRANFAITSRM